MPEAIVTRILRLVGYEVYAHGVEETASKLILWVHQAAAEPYYACGGCGISIRDVHSWTERRVRDLPWGTWPVWLVIEVHRVRCPRCGVRTERRPFVMGKAHLSPGVAESPCWAAGSGALALLGAAFALGVAGLWDDVRGLLVWPRLLAEIAIATWVVTQTGPVARLSPPPPSTARHRGDGSAWLWPIGLRRRAACRESARASQPACRGFRPLSGPAALVPSVTCHFPRFLGSSS